MQIDINNVNQEDIDIDLIKNTAKKFLEKYNKKDFNVSIAFVDDNEIQKINKKYRHIDKPTDVLSFEGEDNFLGEIIINYSQVVRQAKELNCKIEEELIYILVHGLLHLLGYNDETEEDSKEMKKITDKFISNYLN